MRDLCDVSVSVSVSGWMDAAAASVSPAVAYVLSDCG